MNLFLNVLKSFGIVLVWYLILVTGIWGILSIRFGMHWFAFHTLYVEPIFILIPVTAVLLALAFGALYLPRKGRLYMAMGMLLLFVAFWVWFGIWIWTVSNT